MSNINDFNRAPYYDDFDKYKNYLRILFKPGYPVQGRELNQLQSILKNQIGDFADHVFKNGSKVSNCRTSIVYRNYARLLDNYADTNTEVNIEQFDETYRLVGESSKVEGRFVKGTNKTIDDPATMFLLYDTTGSFNGEEVVEFIPGEVVAILDKNNVAIQRVIVRCPGCPESGLPKETPSIGNSAFFAIDDGVIYFNQNFVQISRQEIILVKYLEYKENGTIATQDKFKVGLDFVESIVTADEDPTLLDPSLGYPNYAAPGADRYHGEFVLVKREYGSEDGDTFVLLAKILGGLQPEFIKADAEYGQLNEEFARRTFETSGNFTVSPYKTKFYEAKKTPENGAQGWSETGKEKDLVSVVSPGISYVKGNRNETKADSVVSFEKARDTEKVDNFTQYFPNRPYITVKPVSISHIVAPNNTPSIVSTTELQLYSGVVTGGDTSGEYLGFVKVIDQSKNGNNYKLFIYDVTITKAGANIGQARSLKTADKSFVAEAVLTNDRLELSDANNISLLYRINKDYIKSLRDVDNKDNGDTTMFLRRKLIGRTDNTGRVTFNAQTNESFLVFNPQENFAYVGTASVPSAMLALNGSNYISSGGTLIVEAGSANANTEIVVYSNIQKVNQTENTKVLTLKTFTVANASGAVGNTIKLGVADAFQIKSISFNNGTDIIDISDEYKLNNGQTDMFYTESSIERTVNRNMPGTSSLIISVYYFKHEGSAGFFTVDSYSQLLDEENEWGLSYKDIPSFTTSNGITMRLSDAFDFRPIFMEGAIGSGTSIPVQSTTTIFDVEFYLPRTDLLCINSKNEFYVKKGTASLNPIAPLPDTDSMSLYEIRLSAYTFDIKGVSTKFIENKRYTMRDIGRLEKRIENLEYYVQLNALEQSTVNMNVKDKDGFDRYKNGMLVDSFKSIDAGGDILNKEFQCTYDTTRGELRPIGVANSTKLEIDFDQSVNLERKGNMVMIPYDEERFQENPYATRSISINPYMTYNKKGSLVLSPNIDTWSDTERLPDVVVDIDSGTEAIKEIAEASGVLGTKYGSWSAMNTTTQLTDNLSTTTSLTGERNWMRFNNGMHWGLGQVTTTTNQQTGTITSTQSRTATTTTMESRVNEYKITDIVKDVSIQPYVRSRIVEFYGSKMKANRTVYAFFDGIDVTKHCRMMEAVIYDAMEIEKMRRATIFGGNPLKTDENGEIRGEFKIPANTFFTGEKTFVLTDDPQNTGNDDRATTTASSIYFAGGINQSKQDSTLNVITPQFNSTSRTEEKTTTQTLTSRDQTTTEVIRDVSTGTIIDSKTTVVNEAAPTTIVNQWKTWWNVDPIAQAFVVSEPCFITRLQLYFKEVDLTSDSIWVELRTMQNGYPTTVSLGRKEYTPNDIVNFVSEDSTTPFDVIFDMPIFVDANISYCFVIGGYSPDTRMWLSHLGETVVNIPGKVVEEPPTPFSSFRSINGETWNAEQYENIKHGLYRAVFKSREMKVKVRNSVEQTALKLENDPIEIQANVNRVRIHAKNHGVSVTDRVSLSLFDGIEIDVEVGNTTPPQITQKITTPTGSGIVTDIQLTDQANVYKIKLKQVQGIFEVGQAYNGEVGSRPFRDTSLMTANGNTIPKEILINESHGIIKSDPTVEIGYSDIGGASFALFNYEHVVVEVDSLDSFIVEVAYSFNKNGRFGGKYGQAFDISRRYEMYNISGAYLPYGASESLTMTPIKYNQNGGNDIDKTLEFSVNYDHYLPYSMKLLSNKNEVRVFGTNRRSIDANFNFVSGSPYLSPVINADSFSIITVSNRVSEHDKTKMNVAPSPQVQYIDETETTGNSAFKYVTKKVLMKDAAQELKIFVDIYRDVTADFDIYVKPIEAHETRTEETLKWTKVDLLDKTLSSNSVSDYLEYEISCSVDCSTWKANLEFIGYRVKIVGKTSNYAKPPMFKNLRTIAVT